MLHSLKPFHCPSCNYCFTNRDTGRNHHIPRFPLILNCGHTLCENCLRTFLKIQQKIVCTVCQQCTVCEDGSPSKLPPDIYVLGIISANQKQTLPSLKMKLVPSSSAKNDNFRRKESLVLCDNCSVKEASFLCKKCEENFCSTCFDIVHKNRGKSLEKHLGIPVYSSIYTSVVQGGCLEHDNRAIEFFCEEDNELICSLCVVTGSHKGHPVFTLLEKNTSCAGDLRKAREDALLINRRLKFTEQKLTQAIPSETTDNSQWTKEIRNHFHDLHSALILRENQLISQIESICDSSVQYLEKMCQEVSDSYRDLDAVLRDAELVLENPTLSISVPAITKKLESSKTIPCHLLPIPPTETAENESGINVKFEPELQDSIVNHGKISAALRPKFCLRTSDDLPPDFIVEPLPVETVPLDTESLASDTFSEDSLSSNFTSSQSAGITLPLKVQHFASKHEKVQVSHIHSPNWFYVVRCSDSKKLRNLLEKINRWCRSPESAKHVPKTAVLGDLYLVRYSVDKKWYRGRVRKVFTLQSDSKTSAKDENNVSNDKTTTVDETAKLDNQRVEIFYVDFGNTEIVPLTSMRNIQTQFLNLSGMAKHCSLSDIVPKNEKSWTTEAINVFKDFVQDKEVNMQVMEEQNNILYVDLCQAASSDIINDVPVSVRDALVFLEYGSYIAGVKPPKTRRNQNLRQFLPPEELRANTKTAVYVSHVDNPSHFYVQQQSTSRHLSQLILDMKKVYADHTNILHSVYVPYVGMVCAAHYEKDNCWYRAQIINLPGGAKVEVQFVDFGNREVLHHRDIRKLIDRFTKLSAQAKLCTLADVTHSQGSKWSEEAKTWFARHVHMKHLTLLSLGIIPSNKITKAVLYDYAEENEVCINALLVSANFASSTGPYSKVIKISKPKPKQPAAPTFISEGSKNVPVPTVEPPEAKHAETPAVSESLVLKEEPKNYVKILVSYIDSPGSFFIRIADDTEKRFKGLMDALQEEYKNSTCFPPEIEIGCSYAVFRTADSTWYRGIALKKMTDDSYQVRFVDIGFVEIISETHFRVLSEKHGIDEAFAVECHLASVLPAGDSSKWPQIAKDTFKDLVSSHEFLYLVGEGKIVGDTSLPSDLLYKELIRGGALDPSEVKLQSIREKLIEKGVALRERKKKTVPIKQDCPSSPSSTCSGDTVCCNSPGTTAVPHLVTTVSDNTSNTESTVQTTIELLACKEKPVPREPTFRWKKAPLPTKMKFTCRASHVGDNGCIYVQPKPEGTNKVELITKALAFKYGGTSSEKLRIPPPVGEAVAARFSLDKNWYRAEIVSDNPSKIKVQFIDYGNYEIVSLDDIRLDAPMKDTPSQMLECELFDTMPSEGKTWPPEVLDFIHATIVDQECTVEILEPPEPEKRLVIALYLEDDMNIADLLKDIGKAVSVSKYEERLKHEQEVNSNVAVKTAPVENLPVGDGVVYPKGSSLQTKEVFRVCITQLLEPNVICLQRLKIENPVTEKEIALNLEISKFLQLMEELMLKADNFPKITDPQPGLACCGQYSYDNNWYRCQITDVTSDGIKVFYVDYGNSEVLPLEKLRKPTPHVLEFPVQAHVCKIHALQPVSDEWSPEAAQALLQKLFHTSAEIYARVAVPGEVCEVDLLVMNSDGEMQLIYSDIVEQGLVKLSES